MFITSKQIARVFITAMLPVTLLIFSTESRSEDTVQKDALSISAQTAVDVYTPKESKGKCPLIILSHNGGAKKEDWGDFPSELASKGYVVANIGWNDFAGHDDYKAAMDAVIKKYADKADQSRIAFVGACHGAIKMIDMLNDSADAIKFRSIVFLSVSEGNEIAGAHAPILGVYSTDDHLGSYYIGFTKHYVEDLITAPKKAVAFKGTPHGNELVTDAKSKDQIRKEIYGWLTDNFK